MPATFALMKNDHNEFYFHLLDGSGELLLISGEYPDKGEAEQAIKDVRVGSMISNQIAAGKVPEGDMFFVIKNASGFILVKSILFKDRMRFDNALHLVKDNACVAEVSDHT